MKCYVSGRKEVYHCWFHLRLFAQQHSIILLAGQVENNVFDGTWTPATGCVCESGRVCVFSSCQSFNAHIIASLCLHKDPRCHWCEAACVRPAALLLFFFFLRCLWCTKSKLRNVYDYMSLSVCSLNYTAYLPAKGKLSRNKPPPSNNITALALKTKLSLHGVIAACDILFEWRERAKQKSHWGRISIVNVSEQKTCML